MCGLFGWLRHVEYRVKVKSCVVCGRAELVLSNTLNAVILAVSTNA